MSAVLTPRRVEGAFWLLLCLGLATGIGMELDWGRKLRWPVGEPPTETAAFTTPALTQPFGLASPDQFREMTARPIFVITRRPAPPAPPSEASRPSMQKDQFILTGTTIVREGKFAFLLEKAGNKSHAVAEGRDINGIRVIEVAPDRVVLGQNGDTEVLTLKIVSPPPGRVAKTPATPAGSVPGAPAGVPGSATVPLGALPPAEVQPRAVQPRELPPTAAPGAEAKQEIPAVRQRRLPTPPLQVPTRKGGAAQVPPQPQPAGPAQ